MIKRIEDLFPFEEVPEELINTEDIVRYIVDSGIPMSSGAGCAVGGACNSRAPIRNYGPKYETE
jgi:hypothetical protein